MASCNICKKQVQNHSFQLKCSSCRGKVHLKCLPVIDKHDSIYIHRESNVWFCTVCTQDIFPFNGIDDECEFLETLAEFQQWDSLIPFDILVAQNKIFSPFELNEDLNLPLIDSDPDIQFYNNQCNDSLYLCNYYLEDSFNKKVADLNISSGCLSMIHTYMQSTAKNMNKFDLYLNNLIYRPPDTDIKEFNDYILQCLTQIKAEKKIAYLLRDYNINLLNIDKHAASKDFADAMFSHFFFPVITKPTRVTDKSATLLNNIFYNNCAENSRSLAGILYTDISDHFPVYHIDYSDIVPLTGNLFKKRMYSIANMERFSSTMNEKNWNSVLHSHDAQNAYTAFYNEFSEVYNTRFPVKVLKRGYRTRKPWLSYGMKNSIKKIKINYINSTKIQEILSMNCSINSTGINSINCFLKLKRNIMRHFWMKIKAIWKNLGVF